MPLTFWVTWASCGVGSLMITHEYFKERGGIGPTMVVASLLLGPLGAAATGAVAFEDWWRERR